MEAEVSPDGAGRQRDSWMVESLRHRNCRVRYTVEVSGEPFVERIVGVDELFDEGQTLELSRDQDDPLVFDSNGDMVGCRW